jgi:hypothetical protein
MNLPGNFTTKREIIYMTNGRAHFTLNHLHNTWAFNREDPTVKQLLELFNLTNYRQICAAEEWDIEALAIVYEYSDNDLIEEFKFQPQDVPTFRLVLTTAKSLMQARKLASNNAHPGF